MSRPASRRSKTKSKNLLDKASPKSRVIIKVKQVTENNQKKIALVNRRKIANTFQDLQGYDSVKSGGRVNWDVDPQTMIAKITVKAKPNQPNIWSTGNGQTIQGNAGGITAQVKQINSVEHWEYSLEYVLMNGTKYVIDPIIRVNK